MKTKESLLQSSKHHKQMIKNELVVISTKTEEIGKKLLIATGVVSAFAAFDLARIQVAQASSTTMQ